MTTIPQAAIKAKLATRRRLVSQLVQLESELIEAKVISYRTVFSRRGVHTVLTPGNGRSILVTKRATSPDISAL